MAMVCAFRTSARISSYCARGVPANLQMFLQMLTTPPFEICCSTYGGRSKSLAKTNRGKSQPFTLAVLLTFLARQHSLGAVGLAGRTQKTADSDEKLKLS